jgi:hypothetical protein
VIVVAPLVDGTVTLAVMPPELALGSVVLELVLVVPDWVDAGASGVVVTDPPQAANAAMTVMAPSRRPSPGVKVRNGAPGNGDKQKN